MSGTPLEQWLGNCRVAPLKSLATVCPRRDVSKPDMNEMSRSPTVSVICLRQQQIPLSPILQIPFSSVCRARTPMFHCPFFLIRRLTIQPLNHYRFRNKTSILLMIMTPMQLSLHHHRPGHSGNNGFRTAILS